MNKLTFVLATSLCLAGLLGCESAVLVNNDARSPAPADTTTMSPDAETATYREPAESSAGADRRATTQPALSVETKDVSVQKQNDNN